MADSIDNSDLRRLLPSVDAVLQRSETLIERWGHSRITEAARVELGSIRAAIAADGQPAVAVGEIIRSLEASLILADQSTLRQFLTRSRAGRAALRY